MENIKKSESTAAEMRLLLEKELKKHQELIQEIEHIDQDRLNHEKETQSLEKEMEHDKEMTSQLENKARMYYQHMQISQENMKRYRETSSIIEQQIRMTWAKVAELRDVFRAETQNWDTLLGEAEQKQSQYSNLYASFHWVQQKRTLEQEKSVLQLDQEQLEQDNTRARARIAVLEAFLAKQRELPLSKFILELAKAASMCRQLRVRIVHENFLMEQVKKNLNEDEDEDDASSLSQSQAVEPVGSVKRDIRGEEVRARSPKQSEKPPEVQPEPSVVRQEPQVPKQPTPAPTPKEKHVEFATGGPTIISPPAAPEVSLSTQDSKGSSTKNCERSVDSVEAIPSRDKMDLGFNFLGSAENSIDGSPSSDVAPAAKDDDAKSKQKQQGFPFNFGGDFEEADDDAAPFSLFGFGGDEEDEEVDGKGGGGGFSLFGMEVDKSLDSDKGADSAFKLFGI